MKILLIIITIAIFCGSCKKDVDNFHKYLEKLKEYPLYDNEETNTFSFSYMDSSNANLHNLKATYNLETIAGDGDELSKITNLMFWVNTNLKHGGNSKNPYPPNANNIIETCKREDRGVNCRMFAIVLNEFYLSTGFKSRMVTCEPFKHKFTDCHVVTIVYSNQLNKWIMMDPSFAGFFKDENDIFLDLSEVRKKLINNETLIISNYLNHNRDKYTKQEYKTYMSKNLFRFECSVKSEYNYEALSSDQKKFIELIPLNYVSDSSNNIYTRNSMVFWANP
jgi:hypothetical protein